MGGPDEQVLRDYTQPILRAAGLAKQDIRVVIINDRSFNAFVMDGRRIFINAGALMDATTPNEVIGVLAHEAGRDRLARYYRDHVALAEEFGVPVVLETPTWRASADRGARPGVRRTVLRPPTA